MPFRKALPASPTQIRGAADAATSTTAAGTPTSTSAITKAFNEQNQFLAVTKIWAIDDVVKALKGRFEARTTSSKRCLEHFEQHQTPTRGHRVVCKSFTLPRLPEELWLYTFGFMKHDQQPLFGRIRTEVKWEKEFEGLLEYSVKV